MGGGDRMMLHLWVPGTPIPQGSKRAYGNRVVDANQATLRPWRATITAAAAEKKPDTWNTVAPMAVTIRFHFPRLAAHYTKTGQIRANAPYYKPARPDLDKLVRAVLDALTDAATWADDSQVVHLQAVKVYDDRPGAQITITPIGRNP